MDESKKNFPQENILDSLNEEERKEYDESYSSLKKYVENKENPKNLRKIVQSVINFSDLFYLSDLSSEESEEFSLDDIFNQILCLNRKLESVPQKIQSEKSNEEAIFDRPYWWPKTDDKKNRWKYLYPKIKPLKDKGWKNYKIAEELKINRHDVTRILTWASKSPEAHGK